MEYIVIAIILVIFGVIILIGKGDFLVAGYNTASKEKKQKINVKRLRLVIGGFLIIVALTLSLPFLIGNGENTRMITIITIVVMTIVCLLLANTWCIKK
ncbi:MAG: DUF3784 domain-containing protein [Muribaculaceae bacterium]|nr:DUF3784 domain-containing protein [Muribaculaceae bacterium]